MMTVFRLVLLVGLALRVVLVVLVTSSLMNTTKGAK